MEPPSEYVPRVTKSFIKGPEIDYSKVDAFRFDDSDILICVVIGYFHISFNNGKSWQTVDEFKNRLIFFVGIDVFHKGRAFVTSEGGRLHVTEDQGRSWKEIEIPKVPDTYTECMGVETHPTDRKLLLIRMATHYEGEGYIPKDNVICVSKDAGKSFRILSPPAKYREEDPFEEIYNCHFAVFSKESTLENNGIYYLYQVRRNTADDVMEEEWSSALFYTADFGKTVKVFDELDGFLEDIFIFPSNVIVVASEDEHNRMNKKLWISKDGSFELIHLPDKGSSLRWAYLFPVRQDFPSRYDQKHLLLEVRTKDRKKYNLLLDLLSLSFSEGPTSSSDGPFGYFRLRDLNETCRGRLYLERSYYERFGYPNGPFGFVHLNNSDTLMFDDYGSLYISFNAGESWECVDVFKGKVRCVYADEFHKWRAFLNNTDGKLYVTEDQGRNWREIQFPRVPDECINHSAVETHPVDGKLFLIRVHTKHNAERYFSREFIYASDDSGKSFKRIVVPPISYHGSAPTSESYRFRFAVSPKESTVENDGIYYIHHGRYAKKSGESGTEGKDTLLYTADFGKTTKVFHELKDSSVDDIFTFPSTAVVLTSEDRYVEENKKLWISKGESFEPVRLPNEVISLEYAGYLSEDDQRQLLLAARLNEDHNKPFWLLIFDPLTRNFSFRGPTPWSHIDCFSFSQMDNLKGTFFEDYQEGGLVTKASFDAGKSWTNLKFVESSGNRKQFFERGVDDAEYSVVIYGPSCECCPPYVPENDSTAGIIVEVGRVKEKVEETVASASSQTLVSRDGGLSWEISLEFPVLAVCLDFGNIIVAIPWEIKETYSKFYFSLDQGRTWNEYFFDEPIRGSFARINSLGLKAIINIASTRDGLEENVFYSIDFSNIFGGTACTEDDLERCYLNNGNCIDGVRYSFDRRKPDAKCLVRKTFQKLELHEEKCES